MAKKGRKGQRPAQAQKEPTFGKDDMLRFGRYLTHGNDGKVQNAFANWYPGPTARQEAAVR